MLSAMQGSIKNNFFSFGMTRTGIGSPSTRRLANTLLIRETNKNSVVFSNHSFYMSFVILKWFTLADYPGLLVERKDLGNGDNGHNTGFC